MNGTMERRLPLLFTAILAILIAGLTWSAYREVRQTGVAATRGRLDRVTTQLVELLTASARQLTTAAQQTADRPALAAFLRAPLRANRQDAIAALQPAPAGQQLVVGTDLWHTDGTRALSTQTDPPPLERETARALIATVGGGDSAGPAISPIRVVRDTLVYNIIAPVRAPGGERLGYVVQTRRASGSPQGGRQLAQLIGSDASLFLGNTSGDLWTDFATVVPGPPVAVSPGGIVEYNRDNGEAYLAAPSTIPGTPWVIMIEFPLRPVTDPARAFLLRMGVLALLLVAAGAAVSWLLSRRLFGLRQQVAARTRALQDSEARLRTVTETAHDAIVSADGDGRIRYWNPGAARIFGYSVDEVLGQPITMLMPSRHRDGHEAGLRRYVSTREPRVVGRTVELEGLRKDGTLFPLELSLAAAPPGEELSFTGVIRDITDRKRIEAALQATNAELESFSYSVSHDLRAPLRAIHGFSRILLEDHGTELDPEARRLLGVIDGNTRRMGQLIDDLLAFSRLGRKDLERARVDMGELVRSIAEEARRTDSDRTIDLVIAPDLPPAGGDRDLLRQAVANLLQNAIKFTRDRPDARIEVGHKADGGQTVYYVKDNGAGFDQRYAGKLFGVFQRLHRAEEFEGTGVGLAIVQRIVQRHGGRVWAEGKINEGATFYITLPMPEG
jgi:PAS domain S-box-containing protein